MGQYDIRRALLTRLDSLDLGIPLEGPNAKHDNPLPSAEVIVVFSTPSVATLGEGGEDNHTGFLQVLLKYPLGEGEKDIMEMADTLREGFKAGTKCVFGNQVVTITNAGLGAFDENDGKYVNPFTIYWYARTRR